MKDKSSTAQAFDDWAIIFRYLYQRSGTVGTILVTLVIWWQFNFLDALTFLGIILMVVGGFRGFVKWMG